MRRKTIHTSSTAVFATAAELAKRSYDVCFTVSNTPKVDLQCSVPDGPTFKVQVKGISDVGPVRMQEHVFTKPMQKDLYFAIVIVPLREEERVRFFIMTHAQVQEENKRLPTVRRDGKPYQRGSDGLPFRSFKDYEGKWDKFPDNPARCIGA